MLGVQGVDVPRALGLKGSEASRAAEYACVRGPWCGVGGQDEGSGDRV